MIALGFVALLVLVGCEGTLHRETGVRLRVDSPALGRVDSFELLNADGERIVFDTSTMEFRPEFPTPHFSEHQILGDRVMVTYKKDRAVCW